MLTNILKKEKSYHYYIQHQKLILQKIYQKWPGQKFRIFLFYQMFRNKYSNN